jgi:hypothetical protein
VLKAGSTLSLDPDQIDWTLNKNLMDAELRARMLEMIEPIQSSITSQLENMITGEFSADSEFDARPQICKYISMMIEPSTQEYVTMFLKGLAHAFFFDNAILGLKEFRRIVLEHPNKTNFAIELLKLAQQNTLKDYDRSSLDDVSVLLLAHASRISRSMYLYECWK